MISALARPPALRLLRSPRSWLTLGTWITISLAYAGLARWGGGASTDRVLLGLFAPLALPLIALSVLTATTGPAGLRASTLALQSFGASGLRASLATLAVAAASAGALAALLGASVAMIAHGADDPPLLRDVITTAWVGALGAAAYVPFFGVGATFGARGGGRGMMLVFSWLLADAGTFGVALSPHAQVRSLLGGRAAATFSQRASVLDLVVLGLVCALFAAWRCRRR
jgi:hypothetical protein